MFPYFHIFSILLLCFAVTLSAAEPPGSVIEQERLFLCKNVPYVTNGGERQQLDLYIPKIGGKMPTAQNPVPVIVWIHWGSWMHGSKDPCVPLGLKYHQKGYAIAGINYRLIGTDPFPAQLEDCKSAVRWLRANAKKYGLDANRIGVWGVSAGGHLAALLGTTGYTKEFDVGEHLDQSSAVQCVCDLFGPADLPNIFEDAQLEGRLRGEQATVRKFLGGDLRDKMDLAFKATPTFHVNKSSAPFLIFHGDKDMIVPVRQSERLHEELKKAGVESEYVVVKDAGHGAVGFLTPEVLEKIERFFAKHLKSAD